MKTFTKNSQDGFTVTEMVVVLAVISILMIIALTTFNKAKENAKVAEVRTNINVIDTALKTFAQKHQGLYPGFTEWPVNPPYPVRGQLKGNRVIGGNNGPVDKIENLNTGEITSTIEAASQTNQDDFLSDIKQPRSPFRDVLPKRYTSFAVRMKPPDALFGESLLVPYPDNPLKAPGQGMINVAYTLGTYHKSINTFSLLPISADSTSRVGLAPGYPNSNNAMWRYSIYAHMWDYYTDNPVNKWNYPVGEFAYIPLGLSDPSGEYATAYWLIGYGNENTLKNSPYNQLLNNPNFPNFPSSMGGDGNPTTPPTPGTYEHSVRQFVKGALIIKTSKYEDQLVIDRS
jgi:prepilin-type N-terminal cleavage/methylation domain-containing protein